MPNQIMEFLGLFLLIGFSCVFILPELLSSLLCKIPINVSRQRRDVACEKNNARILLECLCWSVSLTMALLMILFLYADSMAHFSSWVLGICCLALGVFMTVYRIIELWRAEKRDQRIFALEQKHQMPLGQVLLKAGIISEHQLYSALAEQARKKVQLGQVLIEKKIITLKTLKKHLRKQTEIRKHAVQSAENIPTPLIGELLLETGIITVKQLNDALIHQHMYGGNIGEYFITSRCTGEDELKLALKIQEVFDAHQIKEERAQIVIQTVLANKTENLGRMMARCGLITETQRNIALKQHGETGERMGDILVERLFCSRDLIEAIADIQMLGRQTTLAERERISKD